MNVELFAYGLGAGLTSYATLAVLAWVRRSASMIS